MDQSLVRLTNQEAIIDTLRKKGPTSRTDLAKELDISNPSISKNINSLMKKGMVCEGEPVATEIGRKPVMLTFNPDCLSVAAVDFSGTEIRLCISNLVGRELKGKIIKGSEDFQPEDIQRTVNELEALATGVKLSALCVSVPGHFNPSTGAVLYANRFKNCAEINLKELFEKSFKSLPLLIHNDVKLAVSGEQEFGHTNNTQNLMYVNVGVGIGAGLLLDGKLYEGRNGYAGEIGQMVSGFSSNEEGQTFEQLASTSALIKRVQAAYNAQEGDADEITLKQIALAAQNGNEICLREISSSAKLLGRMLYNINSTLDLDMIIIGGGAKELGEIYLSELKQIIGSAPKTGNIAVRYSTVPNNELMGAISVASRIALQKAIELTEKEWLKWLNT
ncbi:MAG: ROK family protein [Oscillospiraceae bacterium]|jgi:predicted NBD/HSP70 family sugar kinase|nr:ROK family protein [Oscillospiraceae bacterium]